MAAAAAEFWFDSQEGLRLFSRVYAGPRADSPVVLCLHGLMRNSRDFEDLALHLCARYRVVVPDVRGRGLSARDPNFHNYQIPTYLQDLMRLLLGLGVGRASIIGTSMGGLMAMLMAVTAPQVITGIVLNDVGPEVDPRGLERIRGYAGKSPPVHSWPEAIATVRAIYGTAWPDLSDERWEKIARASYRANARGVPEADADPLIAEPLKDTKSAAPDLWPLWGCTGGSPDARHPRRDLGRFECIHPGADATGETRPQGAHRREPGAHPTAGRAGVRRGHRRLPRGAAHSLSLPTSRRTRFSRGGPSILSLAYLAAGSCAWVMRIGHAHRSCA